MRYINEDFVKWLPLAREALESGWSERTLHPDFLVSNKIVSSRGQCGVSSAWLMLEAKRRFNLELIYCCGSLNIAEPINESIDSHCWLETSIKDSDQRLIIDITVDQLRSFSEKFIVDTNQSLSDKGIYYVARSRKSAAELPFDGVWKRYLILASSIKSD